MKARVAVLILAVGATLALGGFVAWRSSWVRSWFARDSVNAVEVDRVGGAALPNDKPPEATAGSPGWRGASRKGIAPAGSFRTDWEKNPPKEAWRVPIGGGFGSCSVVGGKVYVQDKQGDRERVVCLDAESGKTLWDYGYDAPNAGGDKTYAIGPRATPTVQGSWVYAVGSSGRFVALDTSSGTAVLKWESDFLKDFSAALPQWGVACSPLIFNDLVIVQPGGKDAAVVAFDKVSGAVKWKAGSNPQGYSSPVAATVGGVEMVFAFVGDALLAVRASDGKVSDSFNWRTDFNGNIATPIVVDDYVFISSAYGMGSALLRCEKSGDGVKLVKVYERRGRAFQAHHATPVYKDKHLFGIDGQTGGGGLKCIEFATGKEVPDWEERRVGQATVILAGDHLILQRAAGELWLVEANTKECNVVGKTKKLLSGNNNWATPALVDGRIYVRDEQNVVCLDVRP